MRLGAWISENDASSAFGPTHPTLSILSCRPQMDTLLPDLTEPDNLIRVYSSCERCSLDATLRGCRLTRACLISSFAFHYLS